MQPVTLLPIQPKAIGRSSLRELVYVPSDALRLVITGASDSIEGCQFEYRFDASFLRAFLVLDEGDLIAIWGSPHYVPAASILYEVTGGSIFETFSQRSGVLSVSLPQATLDGLHEYLIATDDDCILALSARPPRTEELPRQA
jgi:hypothetical protein